MVGSTGTLMTMRLVRSKLRKREETSLASPPSTGRLSNHQHQIEAHHNLHNNNHHNYNNNNSNNNLNSQHIQIQTIATITSQQQQQVLTTSTTTSENGIISNSNGVVKQQIQQDSGWVFPPLPPQPNIYCMNTTDALAHLQDKSGFKRFRTQFSGRFKRLVAKKTQEPPAIPPELRPQLKTIYVY